MVLYILCSFFGFHRQIAAPFTLSVSGKAHAHPHQLLDLDEGEQKAAMRAREKEIMKRLGYDY